MQSHSVQVKVVMALNSLSLCSPASSFFVAYPKPVLLFFGHSLYDHSFGFIKLFAASFLPVISVIYYYIIHIIIDIII